MALGTSAVLKVGAAQGHAGIMDVKTGAIQVSFIAVQACHFYGLEEPLPD